MKTFLRKKTHRPSHLYYHQRLLLATCPLAPINFSLCLFHTMSLLLAVNLYNTWSLCLCHTKKDEVNLVVNTEYWVVFSCAEYRNNLMHVWNKTWEKYSKSWHLYWKCTFLYQNFSVSNKIFRISLSKNVEIPNDQDGSYLFFLIAQNFAEIFFSSNSPRMFLLEWFFFLWILILWNKAKLDFVSEFIANFSYDSQQTLLVLFCFFSSKLGKI